MTATRDRAVAAVEKTLLNAALSHQHRADQIVRAIEEAGIDLFDSRANTVSTPAERDDLPDGTVLLCETSGAACHRIDGRWYMAGTYGSVIAPDLPARVVGIS